MMGHMKDHLGEVRMARPSDVAEYLGVSVKRLYDWRYRGVGPHAIRVGGTLRYRWSDVEQWLDEQS